MTLQQKRQTLQNRIQTIAEEPLLDHLLELTATDGETEKVYYSEEEQRWLNSTEYTAYIDRLSDDAKTEKLIPMEEVFADLNKRWGTE
jgi:hypothetical protein